MKILILVKVCENLGFGQNCRKILILLNILGKILILVNIFGKIDLGENFPQILILVQISEKCGIGSKRQNKLIFVKHFQKS